MGERLLRAVEKWLLGRWYDRDADENAARRATAAVATEERKAKHTERIRLRAIATRKRAERVIDEYRLASKAASRAGERMIDETRRAGR
jgi:hypothetical protein